MLTYTIMATAERLSIEEEVANKNSLTRTDQDFIVSLAEKTCAGQKLLKKVSGFLVVFLFWLTMNKREEEDEEWGLVYIGGKMELIRSVEWNPH